MTRRPSDIELAIESAAVNVLTRKAEALRRGAAGLDPQRAQVKRRTADELDACALGLIGTAAAIVAEVTSA